jgi:hypothetical protein
MFVVVFPNWNREGVELDSGSYHNRCVMALVGKFEGMCCGPGVELLIAGELLPVSRTISA